MKDRMPDLESFPCPNCQAMALRPGRDGMDAICDSCGQGVVFEEERDEHHKKRNYTPERAFRHGDDEGVERPAPPSKPGPFPVIGGSPVKHGESHIFDPVTVPSHVLQTVRRHHWYKVVALVAVVLALAGLGWWFFVESRTRAKPVAKMAEEGKAGSLMDLVATRGRQPFQVDEIKLARDFLLLQVMAAKRWEDLLPLVRKREEVEPLMRGFYAAQPFTLPENKRVAAHASVVNESGRFVFFRFQDEPERLGVVELAGEGPRLDWEFLAGDSKFQWAAFLQERPATPRSLAVTLARCFIQDEMLLEDETSQPDKFLGARVSVPGSTETLFAVIPVGSEFADWLVANVPWEHDGGRIAARAELAIAPAQPARAGRVKWEAIPRMTWNR